MKKLVALLFVAVLMVHAAETEVVDAPDFSLQDVDGNPVILDSLLKDGPVFMSFWAIWCKQCIKELDALLPYYDEFNSLGVNLLALSVDKARSIPQVKPFAKSHRWKYVVVLDPDNIMRDLYNVQAMPSSFIINQDKKIVFVHQGYKPGDEKKIIDTMRELFGKGEEP